jgi:hypothetical protein
VSTPLEGSSTFAFPNGNPGCVTSNVVDALYTGGLRQASPLDETFITDRNASAQAAYNPTTTIRRRRLITLQ